MTIEIIYRYNDEEIFAPWEMSIEEVRRAWARVHPKISGARFRRDPTDGSITFYHSSAPDARDIPKPPLKQLNQDGRENCAQCGMALKEPYPGIRFCPVCES